MNSKQVNSISKDFYFSLQPENILLKNTRRKTIKLVDFGLARVVKENEQVREIMGTPEFVGKMKKNCLLF